MDDLFLVHSEVMLAAAALFDLSVIELPGKGFYVLISQTE
jgi:hypothetical protein